MTKNIKLVWRLNQLPEVDEISQLVKDGVISKDEAKEILFRSETEEDRDKKSLESEIKFLRELVEKLAGRDNGVIREVIIKTIPQYGTYTWTQPYTTWCTAGTSGTIGQTTTTGDYTLSAQSTGSNWTGCSQNFSDIKTF